MKFNKKIALTGSLISAVVFGSVASVLPIDGIQTSHAQTAKTHVVKAGETLWGLAIKYKTTVSNLKEWNNLKNDVIYVGQRLKVEKPTEANNSNDERIVVVRPGDTLWSIANSHGTSVSQVKEWNNLKGNTIYAGQKIKVGGSAPVKSDKNNSNAAAPSTYTVKSGDTLYRIAINHGITVKELKKWNNLSSSLIMPGQKLSLSASNGAEQTAEKEKPKQIASEYKEIRKFNTNIHVYTSASHADLAISKGVEGKLEPLSNISVPNEVAKANLGFFRWNKEHIGLYAVDGEIKHDYNKRYINVIYKDGKIDIKHYGDALDSKEKQEVLDADFVFSTNYSLVQDGKINLQNENSLSKDRHPRTMLGQTADGRFILAVTDGRVSGSSGLTGQQSAQVMKELGAVEAVNLDGGGSSTLIVDDKIKNKLRGSERPIGSAIFITE